MALASNSYNSFKPAKSDKTLPIDETKGGMRYKRAIEWTVYLADFGIGSKTVNGSWYVSFVTPDGEIIFRQKVTLKLWMVNLGVPGLQLFTWNYVRDDFETTIIGGEEVTPQTIGQYLGSGTLESEDGDLQPASGNESSDLEVTVIADWYSPIYLFEIPVGTYVNITKDQWDLGPSTVEYSWAFGEALTRERVDAMIDPYGQLLIAADARESGLCKFSIGDGPNFRYPHSRAAIPGLSPALVREDDGTLIGAFLTDEGFCEYSTHNYFLTRDRLEYVEDDGTKKPLPLWPKSAFMATLIRYNETYRASLAVAGGEVQFRMSGASLGAPVRVCKAERGLSYSLIAESDGMLRVFSSKGVPVALSRNAGRTWEAVDAA